MLRIARNYIFVAYENFRGRSKNFHENDSFFIKSPTKDYKANVGVTWFLNWSVVFCLYNVY